MKVFRDISNLPLFRNAVVTMGSFDGIHFGHKKLIKRARYLAEEIDGEDVIVTFHPHPRSIIYPKDDTLKLLCSLDEKLQLFEASGVSNVVIVPFTFEFSQMDPREYIEKFILQCFHPAYLILGYDHKFGFNRRGDVRLLQEYEQNGHFKLIEIKKQEIDEITISSTKIRTALETGNLDEATLYLGHYYFIIGKVIKGDGIGHKIGFPTANLQLTDKHKLIPNPGIYAVFVWINEIRYGGMLYIGNRPTIGDKLKSNVEVNVFDFDQSLYNEEIRIEFVVFLRDDAKFDDLNGLKFQLHKDKANAMAALEQVKPLENISDKCTIAILNYNGEEHLEAYLESVLHSSKQDVDIVVIDNASTDDSLEYLAEWHPEVRIIELTKNYGYAEGYNKGIEHLNAKYTVLLNSDVLVKGPWLDPILEYMDEHPDVVAMQPKILSIEEKHKFEYAGAAGGMLDLLSYPLCRGRVFNQIEEDQGQYNDITEVFWTSGAAMVVRTDLFKKLGGFDGDYFAHMEEIDFCWRAKRAGFKCMVHGGVSVYHLGGGTLEYDNPRKTFLNFRNNLATLLKNESKRYVFFVMLLRLVLDGAAGLNFLGQGKWKHTLAIIQAHFEIYLSVFNLIEKRLNNKKMVSKVKIGRTNWAGRVKKMIVFDFYILGKRTYKEIVSNN